MTGCVRKRERENGEFYDSLGQPKPSISSLVYYAFEASSGCCWCWRAIATTTCSGDQRHDDHALRRSIDECLKHSFFRAPLKPDLYFISSSCPDHRRRRRLVHQWNRPSIARSSSNESRDDVVVRREKKCKEKKVNEEKKRQAAGRVDHVKRAMMILHWIFVLKVYKSRGSTIGTHIQ